jgi:hypothetical protein
VKLATTGLPSFAGEGELEAEADSITSEIILMVFGGGFSSVWEQVTVAVIVSFASMGTTNETIFDVVEMISSVDSGDPSVLVIVSGSTISVQPLALKT